jgi:hypothetical protein
MVDADGNWLAIAVVPASVQERDTLPALGEGKAAWPSLHVAILDGAFTAERCRLWSNLHGMRYEVVKRFAQISLLAIGPPFSAPAALW